MGFSDIMGLMYNTGIAYEKIFNDGRFNSSMWVLPKFILVYGFIMQVLYVMYIGIVGFLYHDMGNQKSKGFATSTCYTSTFHA
jgi:uncharacterized membrane protein (DUF485 family)